MKKAYIHIGLEKTGTTALQIFLGANKDALEKNNLIYLGDDSKAYFHGIETQLINFLVQNIINNLVFLKLYLNSHIPWIIFSSSFCFTSLAFSFYVTFYVSPFAQKWQNPQERWSILFYTHLRHILSVISPDVFVILKF